MKARLSDSVRRRGNDRIPVTSNFFYIKFRTSLRNLFTLVILLWLSYIEISLIAHLFFTILIDLLLDTWPKEYCSTVLIPRKKIDSILEK